MTENKTIAPGLFAQDHNNSNRDYSQERYWGKNQFNSSFPASLVEFVSSFISSIHGLQRH